MSETSEAAQKRRSTCELVALIYLLGPLSILVGINYELAMRRYGHRLRRAFWLMLLCTSMGMGIFFWSVLQPYRAQDREKRDFGTEIAKRLRGEPVNILYKILELYGELYYAGARVRKLQEPFQLHFCPFYIHFVQSCRGTP